MRRGFIIRFEEPCIAQESTSVRCGTQTMTRVNSEQPDADPSGEGFRCLDQTRNFGTMTKTQVATEQADADRVTPENDVLPKTHAELQMATKTITAVQAEGMDDDPGIRQLDVIRKCY